ncbi:hypothetical protein CPB83DRAFT_817814 [Crepidotus variabilis]|uniref:Uncharacterized protein n=1 Tax=Crepidotus variabilis TaxID=179855 RepID=A0A9P6EBG4_9AGAR|nr:hypothetical protein CPB83DRAFT_817814 [Crepidotus variabilis]
MTTHLYTDRQLISPNSKFDSAAILNPPWDHIQPHTLTVILPIKMDSQFSFVALLRPLLHPWTAIDEIVLLCPHSLTSDVRRELQTMFAALSPLDHVDVSLKQLHSSVNVDSALFQAAASALSDWVLILDHRGLHHLPESVHRALLLPPKIDIPWGVDGLYVDDQSTLCTPLGQVRAAVFLRPPFVARSPLISGFIRLSNPTEIWSQFGTFVASERSDSIGGLMLLESSSATSHPSKQELSFHDSLPEWQPQIPIDVENSTVERLPSTPHVNFLILLSTIEDLGDASRLICGLYSNTTYRIKTLITQSRTQETRLNFTSQSCIIEYEILPPGRQLSACSTCDALLAWYFLSHPFTFDVVLTVEDKDTLLDTFISDDGEPFGEATVIQIPRMDLPYSDWMASMTVFEWRNWHKPQVELSIVTKDRPGSLLRLLRSLSRARFFGDMVNLRINVEQDCDKETLGIATNFEWPHGGVYLHHRVIHGGLLPAVVEAWYPKGNDDYGLLLEDDVEVSPLFYAWSKMTLLRYRYGSESDKNPLMFGVSLYQQKHLELPLEGRRPFDPRQMFSAAGISFPATPYLSQVPCSWGAIYFPEHWREFHEYLTLRLTESIAMVEDSVVPNVRSNHWARSWKRFFIELTYLRGYTMLYPNFKDYSSLSTNHLEVGSHVKVRSQEKKDLFLLPLMGLPAAGEASGLLDLPAKALPSMHQLPILNLTGHLSTSENLVLQGKVRRETLFSNMGLNCVDLASPYNAASLVCLSDKS